MKALVSLLTLGVLALGAPASAGPTPDQPATEVVTRVHANREMPKPHRYEKGRCVGLGNPKILRCAVEWFTPDSRCSATLWVWTDGDTFYFEWHQMRCS